MVCDNLLNLYIIGLRDKMWWWWQRSRLRNVRNISKVGHEFRKAACCQIKERKNGGIIIYLLKMDGIQLIKKGNVPINAQNTIQ